MFCRRITSFICIFVTAVIATAYNDSRSITESTTREPDQQATESIAVDLSALLDDGDDAIVTFVRGNTRLAAHKSVLTARSPVLAATLQHTTLEASNGQLDIPNVEGPVLRHLLAYMYTLQAPQLPSIATQLLVAADNYGLPALKAHCEQQVAAQLSVETAVATAVLAVRHSCSSLMQAAIAFIKTHNFHVMATPGWADAMINQPEDMMKVIRLLSAPPAETRSVSAEQKNRRLIEAAKQGAVGDVEVLLAAGADVAARGKWERTALHWAAEGGHVEVARRLLAAGAAVEARDREQWTPLHLAAYKGHAAMVRLLVEEGLADPNAREWRWRGWTPLHLAVDKGRVEAAAALLQAWASWWAKDRNGRTPLDIARYRKNQHLIERLARRRNS